MVEPSANRPVSVIRNLSVNVPPVRVENLRDEVAVKKFCPNTPTIEPVVVPNNVVSNALNVRRDAVEDAEDALVKNN